MGTVTPYKCMNEITRSLLQRTWEESKEAVSGEV